MHVVATISLQDEIGPENFRTKLNQCVEWCFNNGLNDLVDLAINPISQEFVVRSEAINYSQVSSNDLSLRLIPVQNVLDGGIELLLEDNILDHVHLRLSEHCDRRYDNALAFEITRDNSVVTIERVFSQLVAEGYFYE
jgi:hypothetical protein